MAKSRLLEIVIGAKDKTKTAISSVKSGFNTLVGVGLKVTGGIAAGFAAITAAATLVYSKTADVIDNLAKMSSRLGLAVEDLQAIRTEAGYAGVSVGEMDTAIRMMESNLSDAARGIGTAKDAIEGLGLSAEELQRQGPAQALQTILDALGKIPDATNRTAAAMDIFGRAGTQILTLTSQSIRDARKEIDDLGISLSKDQTKAVEDANDAWSRFKSIFGGIAGQFTATMAPAVKAVSDRLVSLASSFDIKKSVIEATQAVVKFGAEIVRTIPNGLLLILEITGKITLAFRTWESTWLTLRSGFNAFMEGIWTGLNTIRDGVTRVLEIGNIGGIFDKQLAESKRIGNEQETILAAIKAERIEIAKAQENNAKKANEEVDAIESYKNKVDELRSVFDSLGDAIDSSIKNKTGDATNQAIADLDRMIAKYKELGITIQNADKIRANLLAGRPADFAERVE